MKIAFITNHEKTIFFHGVATRLAARGHEVSWIAPSHEWARWLLSHDVAADHVIDLSRFGGEWTQGTGDREYLASIEARSKLRINDVILMDRLLRERPYETMVAYLTVNAREVERFLREREIAIVFGEQTFGIEILTGMLCREFLLPYTVRIPTGRIGLFRGHDQSDLVASGPVTGAHRDEARGFLATFRRDRPRPDYFARSNKPPMPRANWPAKLWKHTRLHLVDRYDETHFSARWLVRQRGSEVVNALVHRIDNPYWVPPQPPARPFVLFPLHRQPEASIDVLGARFSNQLELVKTLARGLPATHDLYVKEHPNGRGDRTRAMLREFAAIPSVRLVDPAVSSFALGEAADLTITISGTAPYEAALLGKPGAAIANMFYGKILVANAFDPYAEPIADLLARRSVATDDEIVELLAYVIAQSFPGQVDNPLFTPAVIEPANLDSIAAGVARYLER